MMKILFQRKGGQKSPPDNEILEIMPNGRFSLWRSVSWATKPATPVGRFAGGVTTESFSLLQEQAQASAGQGDLSVPLPPDSPVELISLPGAQASLGIHEQPEGAWLDLVTHLRKLLGSLTNQPQAAIDLRLSSDGRQAQLIHLGQQEIAVDIGSLAMRADLWRDSTPVDEWALGTGESARRRIVRAETGWTSVLPFDHSFTLKAGDILAVYAEFVLIESGQRIPVSLRASARL